VNRSRKEDGHYSFGSMRREQQTRVYYSAADGARFGKNGARDDPDEKSVADDDAARP